MLCSRGLCVFVLQHCEQDLRQFGMILSTTTSHHTFPSLSLSCSFCCHNLWIFGHCLCHRKLLPLPGVTFHQNPRIICSPGTRMLFCSLVIFRLLIRKVFYQQTQCAFFLMSHLRLLLCKHTFISMLAPITSYYFVASFVTNRYRLFCSI